jgi:uncharacterized membrane protein YphA (DoxX/SURF4 family)
LDGRRYQIGVWAVAALVALRVGLGCHFLYEGLWKIRPWDAFSTVHHEPFTAKPFLTQAKGPLAGLFYWMVPDLDGRERLHVEKDSLGRRTVRGDAVAARWDALRQEFVDFYRQSSADAAAQERLERAAERTQAEFKEKLDEYFKVNEEEMLAHFDALDRFENDTERGQTAPFQKQRRWERMLVLRAEAARWISDLESQEKAFQNSLYALLDEQQKIQGRLPAAANPLRWDRMDQLDFVVTYSLTAIGLCLMLGFCTPPAALGGAGFMAFVVMTQPAWPGIYPPDPAVVGHALLVNKDFVEMFALLVVATTAAGRWGGLDYFVARCFRRRGATNGASSVLAGD